jgi:hypothetical protein
VKEKKVSVMPAKSSQIPYIPPPKPVDTTPKVNASKGPTFNDAFSQFLNTHKTEKDVKSGTKVPVMVKPGESVKILINPPTKVEQKPPSQQQMWNNSVIQQLQIKKLLPGTTIPKVKAERIQPYIPNEVTVQQNLQPGQEVYYTFTNTTYNHPHYNNQHQQHHHNYGNGYTQSY